MSLTEDVVKMFLEEVRYAYFGKMGLADFLQVNCAREAHSADLGSRPAFLLGPGAVSGVWSCGFPKYLYLIFKYGTTLLQNFGEEVRGEELHDILREIDTNMNGQVELDEYLQVGLCEWPLTNPSFH